MAVIWLAARLSARARMIGMPPATLASKPTARSCRRAASNTSGPCSASSALLAVTTCLPAASSVEHDLLAPCRCRRSARRRRGPAGRGWPRRRRWRSARAGWSARGLLGSRTTTRGGAPAGRPGRRGGRGVRAGVGHAAADGAAADEGDAQRVGHVTGSRGGGGTGITVEPTSLKAHGSLFRGLSAVKHLGTACGLRCRPRWVVVRSRGRRRPSRSGRGCRARTPCRQAGRPAVSR